MNFTTLECKETRVLVICAYFLLRASVRESLAAHFTLLSGRLFFTTLDGGSSTTTTNLYIFIKHFLGSSYRKIKDNIYSYGVRILLLIILINNVELEIVDYFK